MHTVVLFENKIITPRISEQERVCTSQNRPLAIAITYHGTGMSQGALTPSGLPARNHCFEATYCPHFQASNTNYNEAFTQGN
jgi:hypothetical protein